MNFGIGPTGSLAQVAALRQQLSANPADRIARHNLAVELRKCGQLDEALIQIERAWNEGLKLAETATMRGHLLADVGRFEAALDAYRPTEAGQFDELIVDEGQDFQAGWADNLLRFLRPDGRAWWLEDPMQNLYARPPVALPGWVTLRSDTNYRTPQDILGTLRRMLPLEHPVEAGSPLAGTELEILTYATPAELFSTSVHALTRAIGLGFKRPHIALISYRGREHGR